MAQDSETAEQSEYERGRWEAIKDAAALLSTTGMLDIIERGGGLRCPERMGTVYGRAILAHEAQLKKEREASRG